MRILIATDAFPPACGGSGWSTYELAQGLRRGGHHIVVVQPRSERTPRPAAYDGFEVMGFPAPAPPVPFVRNYVRNERLYRRLARWLGELIARERVDVVHAQHALTGPPAAVAARAAGIPSVCTVRDYWPVCYWGDLTQTFTEGGLCPGCTVSAMTRCVRPRTGAAWPLAVPWIPYMRANLRLKRRGLAKADAIVAVSRSMAADLQARAPELADARIETIPNAVDVASVRAVVENTSPPMDGPYAVFVGKLAHNKGVGMLVNVVERARLAMPLVVIGDGPERRSLAEAAALRSCDVRFVGWQNREAVFRWLRHARLMIFPSGWPEPLSRVLIEGSALGVPIAAMATGGTSDILVDEETGLLSKSPDELAADVARLAADSALRERLGRAAAKRAETHFDVPHVVGRMEHLYSDLIARFRTSGRMQ
jgi:glycosyltransferase involved in cell wall biosynthesis